MTNLNSNEDEINIEEDEEAMMSRMGTGFTPIGNDADAKSVWVGNVDYGSTAEELDAHFGSCGAILRITIPLNEFTGQPKGFAYMEFEEESAVEPAMALNGSLFRGRALQVMPKRINRPGISTTNHPPFRPKMIRTLRNRFNPENAPRGSEFRQRLPSFKHKMERFQKPRGRVPY